MTLPASRTSAPIRRRPLAAGLAFALALPAAGLLTAGHAASSHDTPVHRSPSASATTWPVTNCADDGSAGTLRSAVAAAASGDTVDLSQLTCSTITLTQGEIAISQDDLTLDGPGAANLTVSSGAASRVLAHGGAGTLSVNALGIAHGYSQNAPGGCLFSAASISIDAVIVSDCEANKNSYQFGGGIYAAGAISANASIISGNTAYNGGGIFVRGNLTLTGSTVSANYAYLGGGIVARGGTVDVVSSTISGNHVAFNVGGLLASPQPQNVYDAARIIDSTISGNVSDYFRGNAVGGAFIYMSTTISNSTIAFNKQTTGACGLFVGSGNDGVGSTVDLESSILADNVPGDGAACDFAAHPDVGVSGAKNLIMATSAVTPPDTITADPLLLPLADNGGPTNTHGLMPGSPAIDAGSNLLGLPFDQRGNGYARAFGTATDIGAFEVQQASSAPGVIKRFDPGTVMVDGLSTLTITLSNGSASASTLTAPLTDTLPLPLVLANPPAASTTCAQGTVTAVAGAGSVSLNSGARIPAQSTCTITVSVRSHTAGTYTNVIPAGALQADSGSNADPASADLIVTGQPVPPGVTKAFAPNAIAAGATSTLTITLANSHPNAATLTADLTDVLPTPLVVANPANASTTCPGGTVTAVAGSGSVTLGSGAQISGGTCAITVKVTAGAAGAYLNTIAVGALQTDFGNNPDAARAGLTITPAVPVDRIFADGFDG
ncbi:choice-of-anchor Q domain-containing protein [Dokdonella sp.]|uniref:DUF7933 domain-containing protein n=1 Tax=Dokdonella sp. TaxID=2291710 RepID=UPI001B10B452|nr:choice-of-anchor Q domain-containing protein [Dokdonella sp.]MBO9663701.1 hypothetical protein [Dokdonella sp.]